jgi:hypothetical protein
MEMIQDQRLAAPIPWMKTLVSLLPLWLISLAASVEGFPTPSIPLWAANAAFASAILLILVLWWRRWMGLDLVLYSLLPLMLVPLLDEILTTYKTPFIFACAAIFSVGLIGYRQIKPGEVRNLFLVFGAVLGITAALYAASNFWGLIDASEYAGCYMFGCYPLSLPGHPWWMVFLGL